MAANVLRSSHAVQMSVFVMRAFVRMREQIAANTAILKRLAESGLRPGLPYCGDSFHLY